MKAWHLAIFSSAALAAVASLGCRTDPNLAILERELRGQEYEIDELDNLLREYQLALNSCRRENATLRKQLPGPLGRIEEQADPAVELGLPPGVAKPSSPLDAGRLEPPSVQLPPGTAPDGVSPPDFRAPDTLELPELPDFPDAPGKPRSAPQGDGQGLPSPKAASAAAADSSRVERITLSDLLAGGLGTDRRSPDKGAVVVVEPRDADGRLTAAAAPVSVVLLDPALEGQAARVGRWDFTAEQAAAMYRRTPSGEGIHLEILWPASPPVHRRLDLFVRYTTADGRKLEARRPLDVNLDERHLANWTSVAPTDPADAAVGPKAPWQGASPVALRHPSPKPALSAGGSAAAVPPPGRASARPRPAWSPDRP